jgi:hypothetical protein
LDTHEKIRTEKLVRASKVETVASEYKSESLTTKSQRLFVAVFKKLLMFINLKSFGDASVYKPLYRKGQEGL